MPASHDPEHGSSSVRPHSRSMQQGDGACIVGLKFSRSNSMKSQSKNLTKQNILGSIPLSLYLTLMTITGIFSVESSIASEMNVPNSISLLSKNSPPVDLSRFKQTA